MNSHHIDEWVYEFITGPEQFGRRDMLKAMKRADLTEIEMQQVIREVEAARDADATFVRGRAVECFGGAA